MTIQAPNLVFPSRATHVRARWAPLLFSPRPDSPEQLVIGIAVVSANGFYLAEANAWRRMHCLFDAGADTAMLAVRVAFDRMRKALTTGGQQAFEQFVSPFSGISLGPAQVGEAQSERALAELWLSATSSLYDKALAAGAETVTVPAKRTPRGDRLPILVREYVEQRRPGLAQAFSPEFQSAVRQPRVPPQQVRIAFSGSALVANFATLPAKRSKSTIEHIKSLVWDLEQARERDHYGMSRRYEMLVQHQGRDDPQITARQYDGVLEVLDELGEQARARDLTMLPYSSVPNIGNHLLEIERRVAA